MKRQVLFISLLTALLQAQAQLQPVGTIHGPVPLQHVVDGDTIVLYSNLGPRTVRLIGIDAPELDSRDPNGRLAAEQLRQLLPVGSQVWIETDLALEDIYGRLLAYAYVGDGAGDWQIGPERVRQVNLQMIELGWASAMEIAPNNTYADIYTAAQEAVETAGTGMWGRPDDTPVSALPEGPVSIACVLYDPDTTGDASGEKVILSLSEPLDTRGYYLFDEGSKVRIQLPQGVQPAGELVLEHQGQQGIWNNSGDVIYLYRGSVLFDSWEYDGRHYPENTILCRDGSTR